MDSPVFHIDLVKFGCKRVVLFRMIRLLPKGYKRIQYAIRKSDKIEEVLLSV